MTQVDDLARVIRAWLGRNVSRKQIAMDCQEVIGRYYNATYQLNVINGAVQGVSATDIQEKIFK